MIFYSHPENCSSCVLFYSVLAVFPLVEPPSQPRNLTVVCTTDTLITLTWDSPEYLGGRYDLTYTVIYQEEGTDVRVTQTDSLRKPLTSITGAQAI